MQHHRHLPLAGAREPEAADQTVAGILEAQQEAEQLVQLGVGVPAQRAKGPGLVVLHHRRRKEVRDGLGDVEGVLLEVEADVQGISKVRLPLPAVALLLLLLLLLEEVEAEQAARQVGVGMDLQGFQALKDLHGKVGHGIGAQQVRVQQETKGGQELQVRQRRVEPATRVAGKRGNPSAQGPLQLHHQRAVESGGCSSRGLTPCPAREDRAWCQPLQHRLWGQVCRILMAPQRMLITRSRPRRRSCGAREGVHGLPRHQDPVPKGDQERGDPVEVEGAQGPLDKEG